MPHVSAPANHCLSSLCPRIHTWLIRRPFMPMRSTGRASHTNSRSISTASFTRSAMRSWLILLFRWLRRGAAQQGGLGAELGRGVETAGRSWGRVGRMQAAATCCTNCASQSSGAAASLVQQAGKVCVQALIAADQLVGEGEACRGSGVRAQIDPRCDQARNGSSGCCPQRLEWTAATANQSGQASKPIWAWGALFEPERTGRRLTWQ